jgi:hypothetical protein
VRGRAAELVVALAVDHQAVVDRDHPARAVADHGLPDAGRVDRRGAIAVGVVLVPPGAAGGSVQVVNRDRASWPNAHFDPSGSVAPARLPNTS